MSEGLQGLVTQQTDHLRKEFKMINFCKSLDLSVEFKVVRLSFEESEMLIEYLDKNAPKERFIGSGREGRKGWYVKYRPKR